MPGKQLIGGELYRYSFQGQEKDPETGKEAFQLRLWDGRIGRWLTTDPAGQYASPYLGMGNNPISRVDPDGGTDNPIYDENGNFLGTDDRGLQGEAILMLKENFTQGMAHSDALSSGMLMSDYLKFSSALSGVFNGGFYEKITSHFNGLSSRPDYDGIVTNKEAMDWYHSGSGDALYIDVSKLNFKSSELTVDDFGTKKSLSVNFFKHVNIHMFNENIIYRPSDDSNLSHVLGTVRVVLTSPTKGTIRLATYERHNGGIDTYNFSTFSYFANNMRNTGVPRDFNIMGYGTGEIRIK